MTWTVEWDDKARRKLDHTVQTNILRYFRERIMVDDDPKRFGKPLKHELQAYGVTALETIVLFVRSKMNV